jgi:hypothetical protein
MPSKPSYKNRWVRPTGEAARKEFDQLRRELKNPRTQARRLEIETRLDAMAPNPEYQGTPSAGPPAQPPKDWKEALVDRVEAAPESGSLLPSPPALLSAAEIQAVSGLDLRTASTEWLRLHQSQWSEVGLKRTVQRAALLRWRIDTLKGTVNESFADYWKPLEARFEKDMEFSVRYTAAEPKQRGEMLDERLGWMRTAVTQKRADVPKPAEPPKPAQPVEAPRPAPMNAELAQQRSSSPTEEAKPSPMVQAGFDLAQRVNLILNNGFFSYALVGSQL